MKHQEPLVLLVSEFSQIPPIRLPESGNKIIPPPSYKIPRRLGETGAHKTNSATWSRRDKSNRGTIQQRLTWGKPELVSETYSYVRVEGGAAPVQGLYWTTACSIYHAQNFYRTRTAYRMWTLKCFSRNIIIQMKNFTCCTVHSYVNTCHGAPHTGLCLRTAGCMALFTLCTHVRRLTNPHTEAPFVAITKGKC